MQGRTTIEGRLNELIVFAPYLEEQIRLICFIISTNQMRETIYNVLLGWLEEHSG